MAQLGMPLILVTLFSSFSNTFGNEGIQPIFPTSTAPPLTECSSCPSEALSSLSTLEAAGNVIFITGGRDATTSTEVLDPAGSCSRLTSPLPDRRYYHSMSRMGGEVVICGGGATTSSCISTRSPSGPWVHHSKLSSNRSSHSSVATEDTIHVFSGGYSGTTGDTLEDDTLEDGARRWKRHQLPENIGSGSCAVEIDKTVYLTGGSKAWTSTWKWNTEGEQWTQLADMEPHGRQGHGCAVVTVGGKSMILVAGGHGGYETVHGFISVKTSAIYDIEENNWRSTGELNRARNGGVMVNVGEDVYILGGRDDFYHCRREVEKFNVATNQWVTTNLRLKEKRCSFGAVSVDRADYC